MPDLWTHYFFAKEVKLENHLKELDEGSFFLGAQGPDFLFYYDFWPWRGAKGFNLGNRLHQEQTDVILDYVFSLMDQVEGQLNAYLYGFLSHYALDSKVHPLIFYHAKDSVEHKRLEAMIDVKLHCERRGRNIQKDNPLPLIDVGESMPETIVEFYRNLSRTLFDEDVEAVKIQKSYRDMKSFLKVTRAHHVVKRRTLNLIGKLSPMPVEHYVYPAKVDPEVLPLELYEDFMESYNGAKCFYRRLLQDKKVCHPLNFDGSFVK